MAAVLLVPAPVARLSYYPFKSYAGNCLTIDAGVRGPVQPATSDLHLQRCVSGNRNQLWGRNGSTIVSSSTGQCVEVMNSGTTPGTAVIARSCTGGANQRWSWTLSQGYARVRTALNSDRCLQSSGAEDPYGSGYDVIINRCGNGSNQKWSWRGFSRFN